MAQDANTRVKRMKLTFIGSGSAFALENFNSNMVLEVNGRRMMIDCGSDARWAMKESGWTYKDVDAIYISHLHADHIAGIEWLAFCSYFDPTVKKIPMYINDLMSHELWEKSLQGGLGSIQNKITTLDDFFDVHRITLNGLFQFEGFEFRIVQTVHVMNGYHLVPSYGLIWNTPSGKQVFLTTDTQYCPHQIYDFYNTADVIFHDCETSSFKSGIHAHYDDLSTLDKEVKAKMWLYHYQDGDKPDAVQDGFLGFVQKGQAFDFSNEASSAGSAGEANAA